MFQADPLSPARGPERTTPATTSRSVVTIGQFFGTVRRQLAAVLVCVSLGLVLASALVLATPETYQSTAVLNIVPTTSGGFGSTSGEVNTITEARIAASSSVATEAAKRIGFTGPVAELVQHVSVTSPLGSQVLNVTFSAKTAQGAADGANAFAQSYLDYRGATAQAELRQRGARIDKRIALLRANPSSSGNNSQIRALLSQLDSYRTMVVTPGQLAGVAEVPTHPTSPRLIVYLAAGLLLGLLSGTVLALVRDARDDRVRDEAGVEASLGTAVVTVVVRSTSAEGHGAGAACRPVPLAQPRGEEADAYRSVATLVARSPTRCRVVMVGGQAAESYSPTPMNLAVTYAVQGVRTVLAAPRAALQPSMDVLDVPGSLFEDADRFPGRLIRSDAVSELSLLDLGDEAALGATLNDPDLLTDVLAEFEIAVLDGVNIALPSARVRLSHVADQVLVVVRAQHDTQRGLRSLAQQLTLGGAQIAGTMLLQPVPRRLLTRRPVVRTASEPHGTGTQLGTVTGEVDTQ